MPSYHTSNVIQQRLTSILTHVCADLFILSIKTQSFHWNVESAHFMSLHELFASQYESLQESLDLAAERIRALGGKAPGTLADFKNNTHLEESPADLPAFEMIRTLAENHRSIASKLLEWSEDVDECNDRGTADMINSFILSHEKMAWILESHLSDGTL